jgi:hypothetical protein
LAVAPVPPLALGGVAPQAAMVPASIAANAAVAIFVRLMTVPVSPY